MTVISELERFELQTAKAVWEKLNIDDQKRLLALPTYKHRSDDYNESGKYDDLPEMQNLVRIGIACEASLPTQFFYDGKSRRGLDTPGYSTTAFGETVQRYGRAVTTLALASGQANL